MPSSNLFLVLVVATFVVIILPSDRNVFVAADACTCNVNGNLNPNTAACFFLNATSYFSSCFSLIPFDSTIASKTITQMQYLNEFYAFTDLVKNTGPPYNLQVNLDAGLNTISNSTYSNDYVFHEALLILYNSLYDAHTLYYPPAGYQSFYQLRPFYFGSQVQNNTKQVITVRSALNAALWVQFTGVNTSAYVGEVISTINGVDALTFLINDGNLTGTYSDPGIRFNAGLTTFSTLINLWSRPGLTYNSETYVFTNGRSVTIPILGMAAGGITDVNTIKNANLPASNSGRDLGIDASDGGLLQATNVDPSRLLKTVYEPFKDTLPVNQPTPDVLERATTLTPVVTYTDPNGAVASFSVFDFSVAVLKLTSFEFSNETAVIDIINFMLAHSQAQAYNNLIIDVIGNGGGSVGLSFALQRVLASQFNGDDLFESMIFRSGPILQSLAKSPCGVGIMCGNQFYRSFGSVPDVVDLISNNTFAAQALVPPSGTKVPATAANSCYDPNNLDTVCYNGVEDSYSKRNFTFFFGVDPYTTTNYSSTTFGSEWMNNGGFYYDRILVVTDGTCGSACCQFLSKMMYYEKVQAISIGGIAGQIMDTAQFCGGNVLEWPNFVATMHNLAAPCYGSLPLSPLPTSATTRFDFGMQIVGRDQTVPRQFLQYAANHHVNLWSTDPLTVYSAISTYFSLVPSGLPTITSIPAATCCAQLTSPQGGASCGSTSSSSSGSNPASRASMPFWLSR